MSLGRRAAEAVAVSESRRDSRNDPEALVRTDEVLIADAAQGFDRGETLSAETLIADVVRGLERMVAPPLEPAIADDPAIAAEVTLEPIEMRPHKAGSRIASNLGALASGQLVTWAMTLAWTLVVPRALGPAALGILVSAQSVSGVLAIVLGFGTRQYLVREMVLSPADGPQLVGTAIVTRMLLAPVVGGCAVAWAHLAHYDQLEAVVLYVITAMTICTLLAEPLLAAFQSLERMKYIAYSNVLGKSLQALVGIALVVVGVRVIGIAGSMAATAALIGVLNLVWLRRHLRFSLRTTRRLMLSMARESLAYWAFGLFAFFYLWIDTIMLTLMTDSRVVGWYGATTQLFQTLMALPVLVSTAWLPRLCEAFTEGRGQLVQAARAPLELVLLASIPIAAGTAMVARIVVGAFYGAQFAPATPVLIALACCIPPIYTNIMLAQVLMAEKRQAAWTIVMLGAAVINPLINLVLIPLAQRRYHDGAIGAAVALTLTEVGMDIVGLRLVGRRLLDRTTLRRCALAVVAAGGMWAAFALAQPLGSLCALAAAGVVLVLLTFALRIPTAAETAALRGVLVRLVPRRAPG